MNRRKFGLLAVLVWFAAVSLVFIYLSATGQLTAGGSLGGLTPVSTGQGELQDAIAADRTSINIVWTLIAGFLVMFMQAGFAMVETGFTRAKNASHTMLMNFLIYALGMLAYWAVGFGLQMGGSTGAASLGGGPGTGLDREITVELLGKSFGVVGLSGFFLVGAAYNTAVFALFLFQMVFMDTAATIPTGAMAERFKLAGFVVYGLFMGALIYPVFANWAWGGGWLSQLGANLGLGHGYVDFAGSSVVHLVGGLVALAGATVIGPRLGKFGPDGRPRAIPGHNIPMAIVGTFILAFGWFGFNAGSTLAGTDPRIGIIATNTMLASAAGALSATLYTWFRWDKPDPTMAANGMLAGLVAITAPCAFVGSPAAVLIGLIAGILVVESVYFVENVLKVDDPVGAVSVHGANGIWGIIALGLLADGTYGSGWNGVEGAVKGLFFGDAGQLLAQMIGLVACFVFVLPVSFLLFRTLHWLGILRVSAVEELEGLDFSEVSVPGYPEVALGAAELPEVPSARTSEALGQLPAAGGS
jgi:Amt family ammonium transporter